MCSPCVHHLFRIIDGVNMELIGIHFYFII